MIAVYFDVINKVEVRIPTKQVTDILEANNNQYLDFLRLES